MRKSGIVCLSALAVPLAAIILLQAGCSRTEMNGAAQPGTKDPGSALPEPPPVVKPESSGVSADSVYNLDDEVLVDDVVEGATEKVEDIRQILADSFIVSDTAADPVEKPGFEIGYRVQIFASADVEAAKELRKKVMAGTGLAVYIDLEGGLYKVRAGDFPDRESAAKARADLVDQYPDCWIVKTTIKR
jgi:hypothetical protein